MGDCERMKCFYNQLVERDTIRIGVIGGSITEGAIASPITNSYGHRLCRFLGNNFPGKHFSLINAGIGSTNSRFACSRVRTDLFPRAPHMVIIEFAVNDKASDSAAYEGLIRLCLKNLDGPVVLFFTMSQNLESDIQKIQARIGRHYNLPMISYGDHLRPLITGNRLPWESISCDVVHPNNNGHMICAHLLYGYVKTALNTLPDHQFTKPGIPSCLITDFYESSGIYDTSSKHIRIITNSGWKLNVKEHGRIGLEASGPSDTLVLASSARELKIGYRFSNAYNASLQVTSDQKSIGTISNYFANDWGGGYTPLWTVYRDFARQQHEIQLISSPGDAFIIDYLLLVD